MVENIEIGCTWTVRESETVKTAIKRAIADLEGCPISKLGTISDCIDITEINDIIDSNPSPEDEHQSVAFYYCGYEVVVYSNRTIEIQN